MCFGTSEVEIVNMVIQLRSLARNEDKTTNFRKGEYDIMLSVKFEGDELKLKQNAEIDFANLNPNEKQLNFDVIEITNMYQPFKEEITKLPTKKNTLKKEPTKKNTSIKSKKTKEVVMA